MSAAGYIMGRTPGWLELAPAALVEGAMVHSVLSDHSHLHECDRLPEYFFEGGFVGNNIHGFDRSESRSYIKQTRPGLPVSSLKGRHSGRVAILFNGGSMAEHELYRIACPIIGMNRTHRGWPTYTGPQPDYLCLVDWAWFDRPDWREAALSHPAIINGSDHKADVGYRVTRHPRMDPFSFDLDRDGYVGPVPCTTGHLALQVAVYMGFTELYCIGLDMGGRHFDGSSGSIHYADAIRFHRRQAAVLRERGINVYVCGSPNSKAPFEHRPFEDVC